MSKFIFDWYSADWEHFFVDMMVLCSQSLMDLRDWARICGLVLCLCSQSAACVGYHSIDDGLLSVFVGDWASGIPLTLAAGPLQK